MMTEINNPLSLVDSQFRRGVSRALGRVRPGAVYSFVQNKPNFRPFQAENSDSDEKRTQSKPISRRRWRDAAVLGRGLGIGVRGVPIRTPVDSLAPNKANFPVSGLETAIWAKKQSQSKPIWPSSVEPDKPEIRSSKFEATSKLE